MPLLDVETEVLGVPRRERRRIARAQEDTADPADAFHVGAFVPWPTGAALPLPPRHEPRPRGRGALHRQARVRPRRAPRPHRRGAHLLRAGRRLERARRAGLQAAADRAREGRGQRRRPAGPVADAARRPPRVRARRGRVRGGASRAPSRTSCASRSTAGGARSSPRTPATGSSSTRRASGSTTCSRRATELRLSELHLKADDPAAKAKALAQILDAERDGASVEVGETVVRFVAAARRAGRSSSASCSSSRRADRLGRVAERGGRSVRRGRRLARRPADAVVETAARRRRSRPARTGFGAFAALHPLGDGRFLAASTDGVGTKLMLARQRGALRACGADLAAHCINDVLDLRRRAAHAARLRRRERDRARGGRGARRGRRRGLPHGRRRARRRRDGRAARASTATASSTSPARASASSTEPLDGSAIEAGDVVIGFPSAGVHANGFTLVRRVLEEEDYDGPDLLAPTRLYLDVARSLARPGARVRARHRRRHPRQPRARPPAAAAAPRSTGTRGSARPSSTGSPATSTRRSCGASSTSASAGARSCAKPSPASS